jgi:hypothetical protein
VDSTSEPEPAGSNGDVSFSASSASNDPLEEVITPGYSTQATDESQCDVDGDWKGVEV